ncbi:GEVED domain-containing protein [Pseudoalteromonas ardens]|uniref:Dihydroxy-acid dehydratase n=1 Tax=Pseudoalteromonas rubra TaxID=43658 RepID=A0A0L0EU24_9GAMM|nr:GEVED domain-containing protein [Pseudoalteromonas sp. R96]KNC67911.1 dihydroxy-acid dehydratase [Pseudoalteromonas rubra]MDK1310381.1 GEVED domain-containing protein [Pseudoalteromonas sp. R96]
MNTIYKLSKIALLTGLSFAACNAAANTAEEAGFNQLGDLLTITEAKGRYEWLKKCYDGLLVEMWEQMYDSRNIVSKEQKLNQLKQLWLSDTALAAGKAQYLTFANEDFTNPYNWTAGTSATDACTTMPPEYKAVALKTSLLAHNYCEVNSYDNEWEWIEQVKVNDFVHTSGTSKHTKVSGKVINLRAKSQANIEIKPGLLEPDFPALFDVHVWIDWDHNGQFDASELVYNSTATSTVKFSLSVPTNTPEGVTLMRVALDAGGGSANACANVQYGEVEDYLLSVR